MKTNNTVINSIMKNEVNRTFMVKKSFLKYICAVLMIIGTSVHAWGAPYLEYNSTKYYDGQTVTINLAQTTLPAHGSPSMAVKNDAGWTQDTYSRYGIITTTLSGASVPSNVSFLMGSYAASAGTPVGDDDETSYYTYNPSAQYWNASFRLGYYFAAAGTYDVTMTVTEKDQADGTTVLQSATITIRFVVSFTGYTITYNLTGLEHANPYNPTATSGEFHAEFELADNYGTPITGTYSDGFVTNAPITIGTSGDCYYNLGDLYYNATPEGNVTINLTATTTCTPLAAPTGLSLTENVGGVHGKTRLSWNSVSNASGYVLSVTKDGTITNTYDRTSEQLSMEGTIPQGNYTWSVKAIGDGSTYCEENDATDGTPFCVGADLSAVTPSNLAASEVTNTTATISWDEVANAVSYNVLVMNAAEDDIIYDGSGSSTSFTATGLTAGTTYVVWWEAVNSCDGGGYNSAVDNNLSFTTTNNHTVSFNANGGSGSMDAVVRTHGTTYDLPECTLVAPSGKVFKCWAEGSAGGTERAVGYTHTVNADITFYAKWRDAVITDYVFSCSELTLTPHLVTASTPIFITSVANKKVRSQDYITITGSGLTPNTPLTFPGLDSKFEVLTATGGSISTDANGEIDDVNAYIFYTPAADATTDGLDQMAGLTVSVGGAKPKQASLVQSIIGRHLPTAGYVIAGKKNNKWYAMPSNMASTTNPKPSEIAVDDINNPSVAYTADSTIYSLEGPTTSGSGNNISTGNGQYIRLTMSIDDGTLDPHAAPLFGSATGTRTIGKSGNSQASSHLSEGWWWALTQTNTSISNPQDAKYTIKCANNTSTLSLRDNAGNPDWGLFASGVEELRLIPASSIKSAVASVVEWGQHAAIIEVDATAATGIDATSVIAHLNGENSAAIDLVQTKAGDAKNNSSKYNYTVNFGDGIDFAAAASNGAMLTLEWKNGATVKAMSNIVVPKIVASTKVIVNSTNYPTKSVWDTEVHVLPGDTLEIDASGYDKKVVTISELNIYPGATVKIVGTNDSLNVRSLVLRNGWTRVGSKRYDVARLYVSSTSYLKKANNKDGWYSDWYIDYDQYYPIAVPFPVATSSICYKNTKSEASGGVTIRYYDGALRAANEQENQDDNWVAYTWGGTMPVNLEPSKGYVMTAKRPSGKAFSIVRLPMTFSNPWTALGEQGYVEDTHKDQVEITAYGADADPAKPTYVVGWNMIANPYMAIYTGTIEYSDATKVNVVNIPDVNFREYDQVATATAKLKPGSAFLVQAPKTGVVTFGAANRKLSTPSYRREVREETEPEQQAYIVLSNEDAEDMMGIFVSDKYTVEYDLNGDVEKMLSDGTTLRTYMRYNDMNMAYVAIDKVLAQEPIPVSVRIPNDGEYTFSLHEASIVANLEGVYLIDHYEGNRETNLLEENYMFYSPSGTITDRFTINAKVGARDVPTDIDVTDAEKNSGKAVKFLYRDKLYIMRSGRIYDATGKQVKGGAQ